MAEQPEPPATPPVTDRRPVPRGVLPRGFQTWLMAGLALGIVLIILIAGGSEPSRTPAQTAPAALAPNLTGSETTRSAFGRWRSGRYRTRK